VRGTAVGFWIFSGFLVGLATSIGARILFCPLVDDVQPAPLAAVPPKAAEAPASAPSVEPAVIERMQTARSILSAAVEADGRWTPFHRQALQRQVALLPEREAHEIVHEMVDAIHAGKLRPE
jgi:hypothetical protein